MGEMPYGFALAAGLVAAFNPCGFAMLPAYLTLLVAGDGDQRPGLSAVGRAVRLAGAMTAGFVSVFAVFGLLAGALSATLVPLLPWATVVIGVILVGVGAWLLSGRELLLRLPHLRAGGSGPNLGIAALYGYGLAYAVASLSCTIGPFLAVAGTALRSGSLLGGIALFIAYALGMGLVVAVLSVAVALARSAAVARLRRILPQVSRVSGALLVIAGAYVAYYGWYELRVAAGGRADDPIVGLAVRVQGVLAGWLTSIGAAGFALVAAGLLAVVGLRVRSRR